MYKYKKTGLENTHNMKYNVIGVGVMWSWSEVGNWFGKMCTLWIYEDENCQDSIKVVGVMWSWSEVGENWFGKMCIIRNDEKDNWQ